MKHPSPQQTSKKVPIQQTYQTNPFLPTTSRALHGRLSTPQGKQKMTHAEEDEATKDDEADKALRRAEDTMGEDEVKAKSKPQDVPTYTQAPKI